MSHQIVPYENGQGSKDRPDFQTHPELPNSCDGGRCTRPVLWDPPAVQQDKQTWKDRMDLSWNGACNHILVGGLEHVLFSIIYMG